MTNRIYAQHKNVLLGVIIASAVVSIVIPVYAIAILGTVKDASNNGDYLTLKSQQKELANIILQEAVLALLQEHIQFQ